ncbi:MAG: NUDIX domain-containing protein [Hyphomonadaceae bacterium JAD_PAG50586_4]|nr:MAG: NUDIX domain-containing protein [Hyphomonadaceae bacterium JAD_PAG50586_4]
MRMVNKIGLAIIEDDRLLLVRKAGLEQLILPGGKPEGDETDTETIVREIREELECEVVLHSLFYMSTFEDRRAGSAHDVVRVKLFKAELAGVRSRHLK